MKELNLIKTLHERKKNQTCEFIEPNVTEDTLFMLDGKPIGFYLKKMDEKLCAVADLANSELLSKRVPKSYMSRKTVNKDGGYEGIDQYSTIIGACPPKPHMRRNYPTISSVHNVPSASNFIRAMIVVCRMAENKVKEIIPQQYSQQKLAMEKIDKKWMIGDLFTSSISNFNISAGFHQDNANIPNTVNVIITKRKNSTGGCLFVPDYNACIEQADNSMLVYPAWANLHAVTPIQKTKFDGYRNSLVFYPLKAFLPAKQDGSL